MNIKDIIEEQKQYTLNSGFNIDIDFFLPSVSIYSVDEILGEKVEYFFLQEHEAAEFISNIHKIEDLTNGEIPLHDIALSEAIYFIDNL